MGTAANVVIEKPEFVGYAAVGTSGLTATGTLGGSVTTTGFTDVGFTDGAGTIKINFSATNMRRVRPAGMEGDLKAYGLQKKATIEFDALEEVIETLDLALAMSTLASNEMPDGGDAEISYIALVIVTPKYIYHFKKVANAEGFDKEIDDKAESKTPFMLETFVEEAATAGERQWVIQERTAA